MSDRERFKKELSTFIAENREQVTSERMDVDGEEDVKPDLTKLDKGKGKGKENASNAPAGATAAAVKPSTTAANSATSDFRLRKLVLQAHPALMALHRDLVMSRQISEAEFWEGRSDLLDAARAAESQLKGKSGGMVDPKPETDDKGDVTVKITPQLIIDIFAEYPAVLRAYNDNVPDPLDEQQFWTRYFQSKLFNRNRTANRAAVNTVKDDPIFDAYLGEEDDGECHRRTAPIFFLTISPPSAQISSRKICSIMKSTASSISPQQKRTSMRCEARSDHLGNRLTCTHAGDKPRRYHDATRTRTRRLTTHAQVQRAFRAVAQSVLVRPLPCSVVTCIAEITRERRGQTVDRTRISFDPGNAGVGSLCSLTFCTMTDNLFVS